MTTYLLAFSISPVQSFIEHARKAQDLYAGSQILSHLCRIAAEKAVKDFGAKILFPDLDISRESIPNRFVASLQANEDELHGKGSELENAVHKEFSTMADDIIRSLGITPPPEFDNHVKKFFSVSWVFTECGAGDEAYRKAYREVERLLGAVKGARPFDQINESGRKCTICGERDVKFYRKTDDDMRKEANGNWLVQKHKLFGASVTIINSSVPLKFLQEGEGVCGVCFTKRGVERCGKAAFRPDFPSVGEIALFDVFAAYEARTGKTAPEFTDEQLIFKLCENFSIRRENLQAQFPTISTEQFDFVAKLGGKWMVEGGERSIAVCPYYAIVLFDVDNMGGLVAGDVVSAEQLKEFQGQLSASLGAFAKWASEEHLIYPKGKTVYAGGDDFLGFVNLSSLLPVLETLESEFVTKVNKPLKEQFNLPDDITFSAGVAIAHFKTPLREVLGWARRMENKAKGFSPNEKNAFAIATLKHSGEIHETVFNWRPKPLPGSDNQVKPSTALRELSEMMRSGMIPGKMVKTLCQEFSRLINKSGKCDLPHKIIATEIFRLLRKSQNMGELLPKETAKRIADILTTLLLRSGSLTNFLSFLAIADFISRKAGGIR